MKFFFTLRNRLPLWYLCLPIIFISTGFAQTDQELIDQYLNGEIEITSRYQKDIITRYMEDNVVHVNTFKKYGNRVSVPFFTQDFEGTATGDTLGTTPPTGWQSIINTGGNPDQPWEFYDPAYDPGTVAWTTPSGGGFSGDYAVLDSDKRGSGNTQNVSLITPSIDCTGKNNIYLSFSEQFRSFSSSSGTVSVSTNGGTTWTDLLVRTGTSVGYPNPAQETSILVPEAANQANVMFSFTYEGTFGYWWAIDNVTLEEGSALVPLVGGTSYPINGTENPPTSFENITSAVAYMNLNEVTGTGQVILELSTGYAGTEPGPVSIGDIPGTSSTLGVTFRPAAGYTAVTEVVGGTSPNQHAMAIAGASYITLDGRSGGIDGGTSRDWTIRVTGTTNAQMAVRLQTNSGAMTDIHVRNLIMEAAASSTTGAIFQITGSSTNTLMNTIVENNLIRSIGTSAPDVRGYGITVATISNIANTGIEIRNNEIVNVYARGMNITGGNPGVKYIGNKIYHTAEITSPSATLEFSAIYYSSSSVNGAGTEIAGNMIYDIQRNSSTTTATTGVNGIYLNFTPSSGDPMRIYNNIISFGDKLTGTANEANVYGIRENTSSTTNPVIDIFYNSVYLSGVVTSGSNNSAAFRKQLSSNLNVSNNIFFNARTNNGGTGTHWGIMINNTNFSSISNNDYFANGNGGILGTSDGSTSGNQNTIVDWRAALGADPGSVSLNPNYLNPTATPPDLMINTTIATPLESGAIEIAGITTDINETPRYPNPGYPENPSFPPTNPDMGAYEFAGIPSDISPPAMSYEMLENTGSVGNRTLTVEITDVSGVQVGPNGPRLYYKKSTDVSYVFDSNPTINNDDFTFTIDVLSIGGVAVGDTIEYYVAAQDSIGNAGTNPGGGVGVNPPGTTPPDDPNSYEIIPSLSGVYTVGTGDTYANLTEAVNALSNSIVTGNVFFELTNNYDGTTGETFPLILGEFQSSGDFTVTFRPALGVTNRVTSGDPGSGTANPLIYFNEGDNYIFDGRPGGVGDSKEWLIRNTRSTTTYSSVFRFINDATSNTVRNLIIEGRGTLTTASVINFSTSTGGETGNSNNTIMNNDIRDRSDEPGIPNYGVYSSGTLANPNTGNMIIGNNIFNFSNTGVIVTGTGNGDGWVISDNNIFNNVTPITTQTGITHSAANAANTIISGNIIGGSGPGATGMWINSGTSVTLTGISITSGIATITNNTISNITGTGTGTGARTRGINFTSANDSIVISNNTISNLSTSSTGTGLTGGAQPVVGIHAFPSSTWFYSEITGNTIFNLTAENTDALTTTQVATGVTLTNWDGVFANNMIYDIKNKSTGTTAGEPPVASGVFIRFINSSSVLVNNMISLGSGENTNTQFNGIMLVAGTTNQNHYYYNSVAIAGTSGGSWGSFGVLRGDNSDVSPGSPVYLTNNILFNIRSGGGSVNHAIGFQGTNGALDYFGDYNVLFSPDVNTIGLINDTSYNFSGWQAASMGDSNSRSKEVFFVDPLTGDLHLAGASIGDVDLGGTPIAGILFDIDGDLRNEVIPYMGADEADVPLFTPPVMTNWELSIANGTRPSWFGASTERGVGWGMVNDGTPAEAVVGRLIVPSRNFGMNSVYVLDDSTGALLDSLDLTGVAGGLFAINDAEVTHNGNIYVCNMTLDASNAANPFKVYRWNTLTSAPELVLSYTGDAARLGDVFTVEWDAVNSGYAIYAASSTAAHPKVYKWNAVSSDSFNQVPTVITLSDNITGSIASVGPLQSGDFYFKYHGAAVKKYSANGTLIGSVPVSVTSVSGGATKFVGSVGSNEYFVVYQSPAGTTNARIVEVPNGVPADAVIYGATNSLGTTSTGGLGDVAVRHDANGTKTIFVLGTNNGIGSYRSTNVIPVELTAFAATVENRNVTLDWATATETNSAYYEIERGINSEWQSVGSVKAAGTTTEAKDYQFIDKNLNTGTYQYRLKIVDLDGTFEYSKEIEAEIGLPTVYSLSQNYPNPFNPSTRIDYNLPVNANVTVELFDITGQRVATLINKDQAAGYYTLEVNNLKLASGVYIYRMIAIDKTSGKNFVNTKKMMMLK